MKKFVFFLSVFICLFQISLCAQVCQLEVLPSEEQRELQDLFYYLFADNEFGYTLLGGKPMSFCFLPTAAPHIATKDFLFKIYQRGERSFKKGVEAWEKIGSSSGRIKFLFYKENNIPCFAVIINIVEFRKVVEENTSFNPDDLLMQFENLDVLFNDLLARHDLMGILLGYGRHNAELFQKQIDHPRMSSILEPIASQPPNICLVNQVNFGADFNWPETHRLKREYGAVHRELSLLFQEESWMEYLIELLAKD